ncbi:MAG TPA: hypothetical protein VGO75_05095 [Gemmatimonadaceae bacterium]|nr:hypothetical protein [Gemmatimonadaceae bacterium]
MLKSMKCFAGLAAAVSVLACGSDSSTQPPNGSKALALLGQGVVSDRYTAELWVRGNVAYTTTWGTRSAQGNAINIWDVTGDAPALVNTVIVPNAATLGDVQASEDGQLLIVATEYSPNGSIMIYSLADPKSPQLITRYSTALTAPGVHTAELQRVNGKLYAFLSIDPASGGSSARLVIVDLSDPAAPTQVFTAVMGAPYVHDVYVRDGVLITALWNQGIAFWDIGGVGAGTVANPLLLGNAVTLGGQAHNVWWYHNGVTGEKRYAFVGQEGPGSFGSFSIGDIHVVDVSNFASPREVAFFHVDGAGTHNFSVDESRGILYAAYYNGGVRAINITGDLSSCDAATRSGDGRCDLARMGRELAHGPEGQQPVYVWGVQLSGGRLYASDMLNGLWKLGEASFPPD